LSFVLYSSTWRMHESKYSFPFYLLESLDTILLTRRVSSHSTDFITNILSIFKIYISNIKTILYSVCEIDLWRKLLDLRITITDINTMLLNLIICVLKSALNDRILYTFLGN
jgi:hypothetical protein